MNPKTFQIHLRKPFGGLTQFVYVFRIHAETCDAAVAWVARIFPGADVEPAKHLHENPPLAPKVGDSRPVSIIDCDAFSRRKNRRGSASPEYWPEGHWRCSQEVVSKDLEKILGNLQEERLRHKKAFAFDCACYERSGREWDHMRVRERKAAIEKALLWQSLLWAEYLVFEQQHILEVPVLRDAA